MTDPLIALPGVEKEGAAAFEQGKSMCMHSMPKGFAFNPYPIGTVLHDNWFAGLLRRLARVG